MGALNNLYKEELIFISNATNQNEIFTEIGHLLYDKGYVTKQFIEAVQEREMNYPTGLNLSPVAKGLPNVAIPHTETEYCKDKAIAFVKLINEITFHNMVAPEQKMDVKYLFFIINNEKTNQTSVLSDLMAFMTNEEKIKTLEMLDSKEEIYQFLINN